MIDRKAVCKEIREAKDWKMTPDNVMALAALLYIKEHMPEGTREPEEPEDQAELCELTQEEAERWVSGMENADGSTGELFTLEETDEFRGECGRYDFWAAMNVMKSDYCAVGRLFGLDIPAFYAELARAFLHDKDAKPGKLCRYHKYI